LPPTDLAGSTASAVSWAAIIGGAVVAAAVTLILLALGAGIGLTTVSPWANSGVTATTFGVGAAIWLVVVQWIAFGIGGYLTGRLRTKWVGIHTDEVFFRDTAHGFLTWALATVVGALFLASTVFSAAGSATHAVATVSAGAAQGATAQATGGSNPMGYYTDTLFRAPAAPAAAAGSAAPATGTATSAAPNAAGSNGTEMRAEASRILVTDMRSGDVSAPDRAYLAQIVAAQTGLSQADAQKRVDDVITQVKAAEVKARQVADTARKTAASASIITALSLLIGAFIASAAAALGGRLRDEYKPI
jgi:hypothetical protein